MSTQNSGDLKMPIVSGQDAEVPSVKSILADEQYSTVFKDTRELARVTVGMVDALLQGGTPEINDTTTYDNGVKVIAGGKTISNPPDLLFAARRPNGGDGGNGGNGKGPRGRQAS